MASSQPIRIGVVCEDVPDFELVATLIDRVLCEQIGWLADLRDSGGTAALDGVRTFCGIDPQWSFLKWTTVGDRARDLARRTGSRWLAHGKFGGEKGALDARAARSALLLFMGHDPPPQAVLLVRDTDGHVERCAGLQQARCDPDRCWPFQILIAAAHTKRECWVLSGFEPQDAAEQQALTELQQDLGFDPRHRGELLTAASEGADVRRNAKKVHDRLLPRDRRREREASCLHDSPLDRLRVRGTHNGLANFLEYAGKRLVPLVRSAR